jgi:hypothetical protein
MKFTYNSGSRPLDGYTIKRGVGKGGFGEVYFAVSDGGKEVALKLLGADCGIELRGIAHCINLKHPNLVSVFDLRTDANGDQWVVMEYVHGEALHTTLERYPKGLPRELAREWFLALARAVGYLHDHGIVHRDLKPANVFVESGVLKVGDYGLCKSISASQRTPQTQSVGTVHYMAPEISTGNYNKQIDIYACGVLLYEMLSGKLPFVGESPGEVLMKHLTSTPDLATVSAEYRPILAKALAKDPSQRFGSMAEMAEAVETLGKTALVPAPRLGDTQPWPTPPVVMPAVPSPPNAIGELSGSMAISAVLSILSTTFLAAVTQPDNWDWIFTTYFLTVAVCWAVLIPTKFWTTQSTGDAWARRLTMMACGAAVGAFALWLEGWDLTRGLSTARGLAATRREAIAAGAGYVSYFALSLGLVRWWRMTDRKRRHWFAVFPIFAVGFWAFVLMELLLHYDTVGVSAQAVALVTAAAVVQFVSPYDPPPVALPRRLRYRAA